MVTKIPAAPAGAGLPAVARALSMAEWREAWATTRALQEPRRAVYQVADLIRVLGVAEVSRLVAVAQRHEAAGTAPAPTGRPRTLGGRFFALAHSGCTPDQQHWIRARQRTARRAARRRARSAAGEGRAS